MDYVFDACAVIALLNDENGADTVASGESWIARMSHEELKSLFEL